MQSSKDKEDNEISQAKYLTENIPRSEYGPSHTSTHVAKNIKEPSLMVLLCF